jgi:uncharacterized protein YgfB (UPF0149 family)
MAYLAPFHHLDRSFAAAGSPVDAAEAHGCLAGSLCAVAAYRFEHWLAEVMPEEEDADEDSGHALVVLLENVFHETSQALGGQSMEFAPLLPDDETPLPQRVRALIAWCTGVLYGLGGVPARGLARSHGSRSAPHLIHGKREKREREEERERERGRERERDERDERVREEEEVE